MLIKINTVHSGLWVRSWYTVFSSHGYVSPDRAAS